MFEQSNARFPDFGNVINGVCQEIPDGQLRLHTYVLREQWQRATLCVTVKRYRRSGPDFVRCRADRGSGPGRHVFNLINVYKAMGGGWVDEAVSLAPTPAEVVSVR